MSYYRVENPLTLIEIQQLQSYALEHRSRFQVAGVVPHLQDFRIAQVIYSPDLQPSVNSTINNHLAMAAKSLGVGGVGDKECHMTLTPNGGYFKRHTDNGGKDTHRRVLSYVLYFGFDGSGGELVLDLPGKQVSIAPCINSLVIFPSGIHHEVLMVSCGGSMR